MNRDNTTRFKQLSSYQRLKLTIYNLNGENTKSQNKVKKIEDSMNLLFYEVDQLFKEIENYGINLDKIDYLNK